MSNYSSQPIEDFPTNYSMVPSKEKRTGRPPYENSMACKVDKVKVLYDHAYVPSVEITWTNKKLRGDKWKEKLEVGLVDAKCIAMIIDSAEVLVQEEFDRRAKSYDFEAKNKKSDIEQKEREASQLSRKRAHFENLGQEFGSSSVRHVI